MVNPDQSTFDSVNGSFIENTIMGIIIRKKQLGNKINVKKLYLVTKPKDKTLKGYPDKYGNSHN